MRTTPWSEIRRGASRGREEFEQRQRDEFAAAVTAYRAHPDSFNAAWQFLEHHPIRADQDVLSRFSDALTIRVMQVTDDAGPSTHTEVWLETGPVYRQSDAPAAYQARSRKRSSAWRGW